MKTRVQRFKKYRSQIQAMDDGDLPIAKLSGKHYREAEEKSPLKKTKMTKKTHEKKGWSPSRVFVVVMIICILTLAIVGIILAIHE